jgi:hypothetical protein
MTDLPAAPVAEWIYTAEVDIAEPRDLGPARGGHRYLVDILGGRFEGPRLRGIVLPGGADRQFLRADGIKELDALYEMQCDDGAVLTVHNRVCIDAEAPGTRYARSVLEIRAPDGPHAWLNRRILVGTLQPLRPARQAVRIGVFVLN